MGSSGRKRKPKWPLFLAGYGLGFMAWVMGLHCLRLVSGSWIPARRKTSRHFLKLFWWTFGAAIFFRLMGLYRVWIFQASSEEILTAFLVKSVIFLYVKVFWASLFPKVLPGLHAFFCPQCYRKETFRFMPVSLKYGFFVTYLCRHCSGLVDAWGNQVFYPLEVTVKSISKTIPELLLFTFISIGTALWMSKVLWSFF